jgi:hypothetical protein
LKDIDHFQRVDDIETLTDEDLAEIVRRLAAIVARYRKARGDDNELKPT